MMRSLFSIITALFFLPCLIYAGNIQVSNVSLTNQNPTANTYAVEFDLSWENSWRTSTLESNWDAAWIVVKYRVTPQTTWSHGTLISTGSSFTGGLTGDFAGSTGVFVYRDANGIGNINTLDNQITWNYGSTPDDAVVEICVIAIEMVYIPSEGFVVGDDSPNAEANFQAGTSTNPYSINSEAGFTLGGTSSANLNVLNAFNSPADDFNNSTTQTLPAGFPKGFNSFYIMKYEMSQQQYVDFLNKLPEIATANRYDDVLAGSSGYNIYDTGAAPNKYFSTTPERACNFLNWPDLAAYADWIGMRPMTELEYEKSCRGPRPAAVNGKAWGSAYIANEAYSIINDGLDTELITNPAESTGNAYYATTGNGVTGPRRCGIISASAINKTREETGATYYGVMEMTGNLWEPVITVGNAEGRQFTGLHGNGVINSSGQSTVGSTWPSTTLSPIADGTGIRGGGWSNPEYRICVSNRDLGNFDIAGRFSDVGGRLVRTAP
ncbi:MAG: SUMF1/EgtB/PvdO family nonheme iron enzyme [Bacteroidetes bacterium]|nr:SUMF1/EgtB/PvdO family nonheme iron enzyme [Bacteroidota bacterium]